jgi:hypothetical protein
VWLVPISSTASSLSQEKNIFDREEGTHFVI